MRQLTLRAEYEPKKYRLTNANNLKYLAVQIRTYAVFHCYECHFQHSFIVVYRNLNYILL